MSRGRASVGNNGHASTISVEVGLTKFEQPGRREMGLPRHGEEPAHVC